MYTAEELAILTEMPVEAAVKLAKACDNDVAVGVIRTETIDRLAFFFDRAVSRGDFRSILRPLVEVGLWVPESVRWELLPTDVSVRQVSLVRRSPTLRYSHDDMPSGPDRAASGGGPLS